MTPEEFKNKMLNLAGEKQAGSLESDSSYYQGDNPQSHIEADEIMGDILMKLGYSEGVEIFRHTMKWYE